MSLDEKTVLKVKDLDVRFYTYAGVVHAVSKVSFDVYEKEVVSLVGETGCGKTVTTRAITRLIESPGRIVGGSALFRRRNGEVIDLLKIPDEELRKIRGNEIAYVFQDPSSALDPLYTIGYHIIETIKAHRPVDKKTMKEEAVKLLKQVLIPHAELRVKNYPHELSGGMRQRAVIATAIANKPRLLIADEPTTNLDVTVQAQILELLKDLQKQYGMSIILITHNLGVVAETSDRVYVMYAGKVVEHSNVFELFERPLHPYTQMLLKAVPNPLKKIERLESIPGTVPSLINPPPGCRFAPRCPLAKDVCKEKEPPIIEVEPGHHVACWLYARR
ncbi:MAG: ABC transporter ATP-binding protein [Thermoprotei archaeon]|nr:MAG: ABC transporter ATP-binding protein [Thermoprotei archaeon]